MQRILPSGRHVALTLNDELLDKVKAPSYNEYFAIKNRLATFKDFSSCVSVAEMRYRNGIPCKIKGSKLGQYHFAEWQTKMVIEGNRCKVEGAESGQEFYLARLSIGSFSSNKRKRHTWSKKDVQAFQSWMLEESTQQWLHSAYDAYVKEFSNTDQPALPANYYSGDDDNFLEFNNGRAEVVLPESVINVIEALIKRDYVQSVSFPFNNSKVWHLLVDEQLRRSKISGFPNQKAFTLTGPDGGLACDPTAWGGDVHIPCEGCCMGDLFVVPKWRNLYPDWRDEFPETGEGRGDEATLGDYAYYYADPNTGKSCHYLLLQRDLGELNCAIRTVIGDGWILYESNRPYAKVNMSGIAGNPR